MDDSRKSTGALGMSMHENALDAIQYIVDTKHKPEVILWGRGMGTAVAVETALMDEGKHIKFMVLDSPFVSTKRMMDDAVKRVRSKGYYIPDPLLGLGTYITRKAVKKYCNGTDPFAVNPYQYVKKNSVPCHIFSALDDDYISAQQGREIAAAWAGACTYQTFSGGHFGCRDPDMVASVGILIERTCGVDKHVKNDSKCDASEVDGNNNCSVGSITRPAADDIDVEENTESHVKSDYLSSNISTASTFALLRNSMADTSASSIGMRKSISANELRSRVVVSDDNKTSLMPDITPLQLLSPQTAPAPPHVFGPSSIIRSRSMASLTMKGMV